MKSNILNDIDTRKNIFWAAIVLIGLSTCMYIYFVTTTIRNIVALRQMTVSVSDTNQVISSKEFSLIGLKSNVTIQYAQSLGFAEAKQKVFITPKSVSYVSANTTNNPAI